MKFPLRNWGSMDFSERTHYSEFLFFNWFNNENDSEMNEIVIFIAFNTEIIILNL